MIRSHVFQKLPPIKFDPNKKDRAYGWATYVPSRTPEFKAHVERRHATSAISQHGHGIIFKLEDGKWVEIVNVPSVHRSLRQPLNCDGCGKSTWKIERWNPNGYNSGKIVLDMNDDPPQAYWICNECR